LGSIGIPTDPLEWANARVLKCDVAEAVRALKEKDSGDLHLVGSSQLAQTLVRHGSSTPSA
jgi:dihydrofolate reductase